MDRTVARKALSCGSSIHVVCLSTAGDQQEVAQQLRGLIAEGCGPVTPRPLTGDVVDELRYRAGAERGGVTPVRLRPLVEATSRVHDCDRATI